MANKSRKELERFYGVNIVEDGYFHFGKYRKLYNIYTADGCCWEKGLPNIKACEDELKEWEDKILYIKVNNM